MQTTLLTCRVIAADAKVGYPRECDQSVWFDSLMKRIFAALLVPTAVLLAACGNSATSSKTSTSSASTSSSATTTKSAAAPAASAAAACPNPLPIADPAFAAAVSAVPLPGGATVTTGRLSKDSGHPGMQAAAIDICDPSVKTPDDLRPIATAYAKALKASPLGEELFAVYVASYQVAGKDVKNEVKIKDPDFQLHLWNGKPSAAAELKTWEVVVG